MSPSDDTKYLLRIANCFNTIIDLNDQIVNKYETIRLFQDSLPSSTQQLLNNTTVFIFKEKKETVTNE